MNKNIRIGIVLFTAIYLFIIPFLWVPLNVSILGHELHVSHNNNIFVEKNSYSWDSSFGFGTANLWFASKTYYLIMDFLTNISDSKTAVKILFGLLSSGSFLVMFFFISAIIEKEINYYAKYLASLFYVFNPFSLIMYRWETSYGFIFLLLPVGFLLVNKTIKNGMDNKIITYWLIFYFLSNAAFINPAHCILFLTAIYFYYFILSFKYNIEIVKQLNIFMVTVIIFLIANLFWIIPWLLMLQEIFGGAEVYSALFQNKSHLSTPIAKGFFLSQYYWFDKIDISGNYFYSYFKWYSIPSYFIMSLICMFSIRGLLKIKNIIITSFFSLLVLALFLSKGIAEPFGFIFKYLIQNIFMFGIFRATDVMFPILILISLSILFAYGLSICKVKTFAKLLLLLSIIFLGTPLIFGHVFSDNFYVKVPEYWDDYARHPSSTSSEERILLLPPNCAAFDNYYWGYDGGWLSRNIMLSSSLSKTLGYGFSAQEKKFSIANSLFDSYLSEEYSKFEEGLYRFGITHILYRNDFDVSKNSINPTRFEYCKNDSHLNQNFVNYFSKNKTVFGELVLYEISDAYKREILTSNSDLEYIKKNPTLYTLKGKNISDIYFLESYDSNWKLYEYRIPNNKIIRLLDSYYPYLFMFFGKDDTIRHYHYEGYANAWMIDIQNNNDEEKVFKMVYFPQFWLDHLLIIYVLTLLVYIVKSFHTIK